MRNYVFCYMKLDMLKDGEEEKIFKLLLANY